jgi:hypothetical protein
MGPTVSYGFLGHLTGFIGPAMPFQCFQNLIKAEIQLHCDLAGHAAILKEFHDLLDVVSDGILVIIVMDHDLFNFGRGGAIRTHDLLSPRQAL